MTTYIGGRILCRCGLSYNTRAGFNLHVMLQKAEAEKHGDPEADKWERIGEVSE